MKDHLLKDICTRETIPAICLYYYKPSEVSIIYTKIDRIRDIPESPAKTPFIGGFCCAV